MSLAASRVSGAWVDNPSLNGAARVAGAWVDFGPAGGGPTYEAIPLGAPTFTDLVDAGQSYNMGVEFSLVTSKNCVGVQWRAPDGAPAPSGGTHAVAIWDPVGTRLRYKEFVPVDGILQDILFAAEDGGPVSIATGGVYVASVYTLHYVFTSGSPTGLTSPSGNVVAGDGRLATYNGGSATAPYPSGSFGATYHISPLIEI